MPTNVVRAGPASKPLKQGRHVTRKEPEIDIFFKVLIIP